MGFYSDLRVLARKLASPFSHPTQLSTQVQLASPFGQGLKVFLAGHTVATATYCVTKIITTCSPMIGQFFDAMIVTSSDKEWL